MFSVHTAVNGQRVREVMEAIAGEVRALRKTGVAPEELHKAREYLLGVRAVRQESTPGSAMRALRQYAQTGSVEDEEAFMQRLHAVTPQDIRRVADTICTPESAAVSYVGNTEVPRAVTDACLGSM